MGLLGQIVVVLSGLEKKIPPEFAVLKIISKIYSPNKIMPKYDLDF